MEPGYLANHTLMALLNHYIVLVALFPYYNCSVVAPEWI